MQCRNCKRKASGKGIYWSIASTSNAYDCITRVMARLKLPFHSFVNFTEVTTKYKVLKILMYQRTKMRRQECRTRKITVKEEQGCAQNFIPENCLPSHFLI